MRSKISSVNFDANEKKILTFYAIDASFMIDLALISPKETKGAW